MTAALAYGLRLNQINIRHCFLMKSIRYMAMAHILSLLAARNGIPEGVMFYYRCIKAS